MPATKTRRESQVAKLARSLAETGEARVRIVDPTRHGKSSPYRARIYAAKSIAGVEAETTTEGNFVVARVTGKRKRRKAG